MAVGCKTGEFDIEFPGATILCDNEKKRESILDFLIGRKNCFDIDVDFSNEEQAFADMVYNTTYIHEGRHLHDHLLCPCLMHNTMLKLSALYYTTLAAQSWTSSSFRRKKIPVPFLPWLILQTEEKQVLLKKAHLQESDVPMYSIQQAAGLLNGSFNCDDFFMRNVLLGAIHAGEYTDNARLQDLDPYNTNYSVRNFTETMAFVQQVTAISIKYGHNGDCLIQQFINDSIDFFIGKGKETREYRKPITPPNDKGYTTYTSMFVYAWRFCHHNMVNPLYVYPLIEYIMFWALSGNVFFDGKKACTPRNRCERLFNLDNQIGVSLQLNQFETISSLFKLPFQIFYQWDNLISNSYIKKTRLQYQTGGYYDLDTLSSPINYPEFYRKAKEKERQMSHHFESLGIQSLSDYINDYCAGMADAAIKFTNNPLAYLYPENYYNNFEAHTLPNVPYRIKFIGVTPITQVECPQMSKDLHFSRNYIYGNGVGVDNDSTLLFDYKHYLACEQYINYTNALYHASSDSDVIDKFLPNSNLWFWELE